MKCGAIVSLRIEGERRYNGRQPGMVWEYYSHPKTYKSAKIQCGSPQLPPVQDTVESDRPPLPSSHSPSIPPRRSPRRASITSLPGKPTVKPALQSQPAAQGTTNRCGICNVIFNGKEDKGLKKLHKGRNHWLQCQKCAYKGHARCLGINIKKNARKLPVFLCPEHVEH